MMTSGPITGYSVRYGVMGSSERKIEEVVGDQRTATISGLAATTVYEYEVAGITTADTGAYSDPITTLTQFYITTTEAGTVVPLQPNSLCVAPCS